MRWGTRRATWLAGIIVALLFMLSLTPAFTADTRPEVNREGSVRKTMCTGPDWNVGDQWVYRVNPIGIAQETADRQIDVIMRPGDVTLEVVDATGDSYQVDGDCRLTGNFEVVIESAPVRVSGELTTVIPSKLHGETWRQQSDIALESHRLDLSGIVKLKIEENPLIHLPLPPLYVPVTVSLDADLDRPLPVLQFPMDVGQIWGINDTVLTLDGLVKSIWLKAANAINAVLLRLGMELIPAELAELLPVIDLAELLSVLGHGNVFNLPVFEYAFVCLASEEVTVPAGTYDAFKVVVLGGVATFYYAPDAERIIKATVDGEKVSTLTGDMVQLSDIHIELAATG